MHAKWCRPGTSGLLPRTLCGFTPKNQPVWGPILKDMGKNNTCSWRTNKLVTGVPDGRQIHQKDMYWAVTEARDCERIEYYKGPPSKRAKRQTRTRFQNYMLRDREPYVAAQRTGEPLFDQDSPYLKQSFDSDHERTYYGLGFVMPHDELSDLIYTNSMRIGRAKMHSEMAQEAPWKARKKAVKRERREEEDEARKKKKARPNDEEEEESWGTWNGQ